MSKEDSGDLIRGQAAGAFSRWLLPSFDEGGAQTSDAEEPLAETLLHEHESAEHDEQALDDAQLAIEEMSADDVKPLTLDELEHIRQEAHQEAYNEGFAVGEKEGFHSGQLKAQQEVEVLLAPRVQRLEQLMQQLFEPIAEQDQALEKSMLDLLMHLVREVIRRELSMDSSQIVPVVREALKLLPVGPENVRIHVNPQDFAQLKALRERHEEQWRILEDDSLMPGGCRVETEHSQIDATVETRLARAMEQVFALQQERAAHPPAPDLVLDLDTAPHAP